MILKDPEKCPACHKMAFSVVIFKGGNKKYIHEMRTWKSKGSQPKTVTVSCMIRKPISVKSKGKL